MRAQGIRVIACLLVGAALVFSSVAPGRAADSDLLQKKKELEEVNRQLELRKQQLERNKKERNAVLEELSQIDRDISETTRDLERIEQELKLLEENIQETEEQLKEKEADLQKRTEYLHKRLQDIYMEGNVSFLEVLLESTSMSDFVTRFDFLTRIAEQDSRLVRELAAERDQIEQRKKELMTKKEEVAVLRQTILAKREYLAARSADRKAVLSSLNTEREAYLRAVQELEESSRRLTQLIQQMQSGGQPRQGTGRFIWPAAGPITSSYGMRYHPILHEYRMHTGIDIGAPHGAAVKAADDGTVIYAGWMGGYGQVVVIDHGGGYSTLYAHLSSVLVGKGDGVNQGQTIGRVGSTGWSTGPHLHFEVRVNGNPQNPLSYL